MLRRGFTYRLDLARFKKPQQFGLQGDRQRVHLIKKHSAAIGGLESTQLVTGCPGKGAFLVPEQFGLSQRLG